jgi:hypothetical protein
MWMGMAVSSMKCLLVVRWSWSSYQNDMLMLALKLKWQEVAVTLSLLPSFYRTVVWDQRLALLSTA